MRGRGARRGRRRTVEPITTRYQGTRCTRPGEPSRRLGYPLASDWEWLELCQDLDEPWADRVAKVAGNPLNAMNEDR
jgi:hypothetical protein